MVEAKNQLSHKLSFDLHLCMCFTECPLAYALIHVHTHTQINVIFKVFFFFKFQGSIPSPQREQTTHLCSIEEYASHLRQFSCFILPNPGLQALRASLVTAEYEGRDNADYFLKSL